MFILTPGARVGTHNPYLWGGWALLLPLCVGGGRHSILELLLEKQGLGLPSKHATLIFMLVTCERALQCHALLWPRPAMGFSLLWG